MRRTSPEYREVFEKALSRGSVRIPLATAQEARNLRSYLYHYRGALKSSDPAFWEKVKDLKFLVHPKALEISTSPAPGVEALRKIL